MPRFTVCRPPASLSRLSLSLSISQRPLRAAPASSHVGKLATQRAPFTAPAYVQAQSQFQSKAETVPRKDAPDPTPTPTETSKSSSGDAGAAHADTAFDPSTTDPAAEERHADQQSQGGAGAGAADKSKGNPLKVSPADKHANQSGKDSQ